MAKGITMNDSTYIYMYADNSVRDRDTGRAPIKLSSVTLNDTGGLHPETSIQRMPNLVRPHQYWKQLAETNVT
jgi:hypothetical protein